MRLGEIKNIIGKVTNEAHEIYVDAEPAFAGQAYRIGNFADLFEAFLIVKDLSWNETPVEEALSVFD